MASSNGKLLGWFAGIGGTLVVGLLLSDKNDDPWALVFGRWVLEMAQSAIRLAWDLITWNTDLPLGGLLVIVGASLLIGAALRGRTALPAPNVTTRLKRDASQLTDAELAVLKILAKQGTAWHSFRDIHTSGPMSDLLVEKSLHTLIEETDFLLVKPDSFEGYRVRLSPSGGDLALARGWATNRTPQW